MWERRLNNNVKGSNLCEMFKNTNIRDTMLKPTATLNEKEIYCFEDLSR